MENNILKVNQITVEDTEHYTVLKLLHKLISKINELVCANGDIYDKLDYLLKEGLPAEVVKALTDWLNDGTLSDIITEEVLVDIDSRLDTLADSLAEFQAQTNAQLYEIANKGTTVEVLERVTKEEIDRQIADGTMTNLAIKDNSITSKKLKDNSITPIKTTFFDKISSKNLFDESDCVDGYYRSYSDGDIKASSNFFYTKDIKLEQGDYTLSTKTGRNASCQICFLSNSGEYVSGLNLTSSSEGQPTPTFSMPSIAKYACFSLPLSEKGTFQLEKGPVATSFVEHNDKYFLKNSYIDAKTLEVPIKENSITPIKTTFFDKISSKNLFDESDCVDGHYRSYLNGDIKVNSNFFYTKDIKLEQGDYTLSTKTGRNASCQICFLSNSGEYVSGLNLTSSSEGQPTPTFSMPSNAKYACFSLPLSDKGTFQLEKGTVATSFVEPNTGYLFKTSYLNIKEIKNELQRIQHDTSITVDSTTNLRHLFSSLTDFKGEVTIYLKEGTYDTLSYYTSSEIAQSDFYGLFIPDNVRLVGLGSRENVILTATFNVKNVNVSTINLAGTCHLENLTVIGNKTRYAIHDDFAELSTYDNYYYRTIKNCVIKGIDTYYSVAYGSGTRSGAIWMIENTQFINLTGGYAFATHSRYDFELANDITIKNCDFIAKSNYAIKVGGMESGVTNKLHFIGCRMNGIEIREENVGSATGIDYEIDGYGNSKDMLYIVTNTDDKTYSYCFSDESIKAYAYTNITKGNPVQYANGSVSVLTGSDMNKFYGVAMQTANGKEICIVKRAGMVKLTDIDLEATIGDKIVIQSGSFVVDNSSSDYIGRCTIDGYIKLQ